MSGADLVPPEAHELTREILDLLAEYNKTVDTRAMAGVLISLAFAMTVQECGPREAVAVMRRHVDLIERLKGGH